jgi:protoporphyrinogen oxidase
MTLCNLFFDGFHELYTAGLYGRIAPQDPGKSPHGATLGKPKALAESYNGVFYYPRNGLDVLIRGIAHSCDIHYRKEVVGIDVKKKEVHFLDGEIRPYRKLLSTLPLRRMMEMSDLGTGFRPDPFTSVLVLNIGAEKGRHCPHKHWIYIPENDLGFFRVGFYSQVDASFLPASVSKRNTAVSLYVERAFLGGKRPTARAITIYKKKVIEKLQKWGFIRDVEVICHDWINTAYTWSWPGSSWRAKSLAILQQNGIYQIGRYGRWRFQGIAASLREGLTAGHSWNERVR